MSNQALVGLINNAALLLALGVLYQMLPLKPKPSARWLGGLVGIIIGAIGIAVMLNPWQLLPGLVFDTRSILLSIAGLFFGLIPTLIAVAMTAALRIYQGGSGAVMGVGVIVTSAAIGLLWRGIRRPSGQDYGWLELYGLGIIVHLSMLCWILALPGPIRDETFRNIALPVMLIYPIGTVLLGRLLARQAGHRDAEILLRESEERFRTAFDNASIGRSLTGIDGQFIRVNRALCDMLGYPVQDLIELTCASVTHPDDMAVSREGVRCLLAGEQATYRMQKRYLHHDGSIVWADVSTILVRDEDEKPVHFITDIQNTTEAKQARAEIERLAKFPAENPNPVMRIAGDGTVLYANNASSILLDSWRCQVGQPLPPTWHGMVEKALSSNAVTRAEANSGNRFFSLDFAPIVDMGYVNVYGSDITDRKQAEDALYRETERAQRYLDIVGTAVIAISSDETVGLINQAGCQLLGYGPEDIVGKNWFDHFLPECQREDTKKVFAQLLSGEIAPVEYYENPIITSSGEERMVAWHNTIMRDETGTVTGTLTAGSDITERKLAEKEIRKLNAELEQRVIERTDQLAAANRELEAFAYSVSHDLRAPLRGIDGFSKALLEDYSDQMDTDAKHYLHRVRSATQRMGQLIDDLLRLSRVTRTELTRMPVDLSALVGEIAAELSQEDTSRQVTFHITNGLTANADPHLIRIVIDNLLRNAWKFTGKNPAASITFDASEDKREAIFWVKDDGVGFDARYQDKLFGAFQRLHGESEFEGVGIGLAIVQRIIHRHGGRVWAESVEGQGATFFFTLPLKYTEERT